MKINLTKKQILTIGIFCLVGLFIAYSYISTETTLFSKPVVAATVISLPIPQAPVAGAGVPTVLNMGMPQGVPIANFQAPQTATHIKQFTLVAQAARVKLNNGTMLATWTFNGMVPGPVLRVQQGDLVVVNLVNYLSFGVTIHWHGVRVPNIADGVAGVTQDAVKPGQTYTYRFVAKDSGTYWYHSHQLSYEETSDGLYGMFIVDPANPTTHDDVDLPVALHIWNGANNQSLFAINSTTDVLKQVARPGQWVRLRIANTSELASTSPEVVTLVGAPFQVAALDGHDLHGPQWLNEAALPIGTAQRYDIRFQMPAHGSVALLTSPDAQHYQASPAIVLGQGSMPATLPAIHQSWFDLSSYGQPAQDTITPQSHFAASYNIVLNNQIGSSFGRMGMTYTLNGKTFPDTGMIMVKEGQITKIHFDNQSNLYHPMHLHGHIFTVLAQNGHALTGSPVHLDTVLVAPHETVDVAFLADNPGIWMLHCHNFLHANWGMDMMVMYNVSTSYTVGTSSGNFPD